MARMTKEKVIEALRAIPDFNFDENAKYSELCKMLEAQSGPEDSPPPTAKQIKITNRIKKRPTFMGDAVRNQHDTEFLNIELRKREHKGKIKRVTTIKEYDVSADGYLVTEFIIDLKD